MTQPYAKYRIDDNVDRAWMDMPEVRPRSRARLADGEDGPAWVMIDKKGVATFDPAKVEIDDYAGEGYEAVCAEGEAYWANRDANDEQDEE